MQPVLTALQMAALDRYTIETLGLDGKLLMSNAARETLRVLRERFPNVKRPVIFAGTGNNGGDGIALAYYAQAEGLNPLLVLCHPEISDPPKLAYDAEYFYNIATRAYLETRLLDNPALTPEALATHDADLVVDALFGTGLNRPLDDYWLGLIDRLNLTSCPLMAIDCPSGLNSTSGEIMGAVLKADLTVTMGHPKRGFYHPQAVEPLGELEVVQLGFSSLSEAEIAPECHAWPDALWSYLRVPRAQATHKGHYGRVLIVTGHRCYPGAPQLAARAALRMGAGLVRLVVPEDIYAACCTDPSIMVDSHPTDGTGGFAAEPTPALLDYLDWADSLVIGPGIGEAEAATNLTQALLTHRALPTVVDADGLRALPLQSERERWPLVLTPHVGELARLVGALPGEALDSWFDLCSGYATGHDVFLLAKSNQSTIATPEGALIFPGRGTPALATGGTGDVLSGIIGALLARLHAIEQDPAARLSNNQEHIRLSIAEILASAVNIHAAAAQVGISRLGEEGLSASDLPDLIPLGLSRLL